jgi:putative DNA primase/helicase
LPHGRREGYEWVATNPNRNDQNPGSLKINLEKGIGSDFATGDTFDLIGLDAFVHRTSDYEAACRIAGIYPNKKDTNITSNSKSAPSLINNFKQMVVEEELLPLTREEMDELISPLEVREVNNIMGEQGAKKVINNPPPITERDTIHHNKQYGCNPSAFYHYQNKDGATIGYIVRYDFINANDKSDKVFAPYTYNSEQKCWSGKKGFGVPRPLYNLHEIATDKSRKIIVNEGEKSCLASQILFPDHIATTSAFGANSPSKTDWQSLVGRDVIIIPDHDIAGQRYAEAVKKLCEKAGGFKSLTIFNTKLLGGYVIANSEIVKREGDVPQGYDAADAVNDGWTVELIQQAIKDVRFKDLFKKANVTQIVREELKKGEEELEFDNKRYKLTKNTLYLEELVEQPVINEDGSIDMLSNKRILVPKFVPLCGYLKITRKVRDGDDDNWGLTLSMVSSEGKEKEIYLKQQDVSKDGAIISFLLNKGLRIYNVTNKTRNKAIYEYINNSEPKKYALGVDKTGWHGNSYIMPYVDNRKNSYVIDSGQTINNEEFVLQCDISALRRQERKGTLQSWQEHIGEYCKGNSRLVVACCAAITSTILSRVGEEGYCLHFAGSSSKGKSTTLYVASSIFGTGKPESFRATDNALESSCRNANDALLTLDELQEIDGNVIDKVIYMLSNGVGKLRARKDGTAQKAVTFTVLGLTSGETGVASKLAERNKTPTAGMGVRFIEILAEVDPELGIFENIYHFENAAVFAEHLQRASLDHCGVVIDEFMKLLVANFDDIISRVIKLKEEWLKKYVTGEVDGQIRRVAKKFALQAAIGEIAIIQGIFPFEEGEAVRSNKMLFDNWVAQRGGTGSFELQSIKNRLISFIQEERNARLLNANGDGFDKGLKSIGFIRVSLIEKLSKVLMLNFSIKS